jgi:hypothetical protein
MRYVPGVGFEFNVKRASDRAKVQSNRVYVTVEQLNSFAERQENQQKVDKSE